MAQKLGKVVKDVVGYKVRIMLASKTSETPGRGDKVVKVTRLLDSGTFGVYAGKKKLVKNGFKSVDEATTYIFDKVV